MTSAVSPEQSENVGRPAELAFRQRVARFAAGAGIEQFLDVDAGGPAEPGRLLAGVDPAEPVAVSLIGPPDLLGEETTARLVGALVDAVASGSFLSLTGADPDRIERLLAGLDVVDPGVVAVHRWRPDADDVPDAADAVYGAVACKL